MNRLERAADKLRQAAAACENIPDFLRNKNMFFAITPNSLRIEAERLEEISKSIKEIDDE